MSTVRSHRPGAQHGSQFAGEEMGLRILERIAQGRLAAGCLAQTGSCPSQDAGRRWRQAPQPEAPGWKGVAQAPFCSSGCCGTTLASHTPCRGPGLGRATQSVPFTCPDPPARASGVQGGRSHTGRHRSGTWEPGVSCQEAKRQEFH